MQKTILFTLLIFFMISTLTATSDIDRDQIINQQKSMLTSSSLGSSVISGNIINLHEGMKGVLIVQIPDDSLGGTIYACQRDTTYDGGVGYDVELVDDIDVPVGGWELDSFTVWFGGWGVPWTGFGAITNFYFIVWEDSTQATPYPKMDSLLLIILEVGSDVIITDYNGTRGRADGVFPPGFSLPGAAKYWIEFKPTNPFTSNSQTGMDICTSAGGNYAYMSYPLINIDRWTVQTFELSFVLYGNEMLAVEETPVVNPVDFKINLLTPVVMTNNVNIQYTLPTNSEVSFRVFDLSGREVRNNNYGMVSAGIHTIGWKCIDNNNNQVSAGTYFFRLEAGEHIATGKLIIAR